MAKSGYKRTFSESQRERPILQRLTPLSWLLLAVAALFAAGLIWTIFSGFRTAQNNATNMAEALGTPLAKATAPVKAAAPAQREYWVALLQRSENGTIRGPQEVERAIVGQVKNALEWSSRQTPQSYIQGYEQHARSVYTGEWQDLEIKAVRDFAAFGIQVSGAYSVEVMTFAEDGTTADVAIRRVDIVIDGYDKKTLQRVETGVKVPNNGEVVRVAYDPVDRIWKPKQTLYKIQ